MLLLPLSIPPVRLKREADRGTCTKAGHYPSHPRMRQEKEEACERNPPPSGKLIKIRDAHLHLFPVSDGRGLHAWSEADRMARRQLGRWEGGGGAFGQGALLALHFEDGFLNGICGQSPRWKETTNWQSQSPSESNMAAPQLSRVLE
ncbi:hypothetical protein CEXT_586441 [Caerostris extrusa]|uniref:Uncharacterized protein n=1 Tax=Caerostris extrusa TaxID=172846 RepID=A0AAV4RFD8_CAEEX|nr:hypothetical protein CEXT_586441 [Caerostris extrusa]